MTINKFIHTIAAASIIMLSTGCSSLGLSLFPTGHYLTEQSVEILKCSPRAAEIPRELSLGVEPVHYLHPGDMVLIEPVELDSEVRIPADQKILTDGTVDLGKFGRVVLAGHTVEGAEALIEQSIVASGEASEPINVRLLDPVHRFYVLGEVNSPGSYPLEGHESVLDGILAAGGLTSAAAPCKILLARPTMPTSCRVTLPVCYREITQLGDTTTNYQLQPGDRIFVATRTFCEDLMFWQADKTCERCCKCQKACLDPNMIARENPMGCVAVTPVSASIVTENAAVVRTEVVDVGTTSRPVAPSRLPDTNSNRSTLVDGELDFGDVDPMDRFEPLWITPSEPAESP
ncbi:SLBB domain protein [Rubripirellula tenax]|uniref:SLBB domain protein n=2 Tax=Rubripirellula tenax TaxID=2528015 RepID=A0A5C6EI71_9BACT|nr:SLBB domain protein [Rubripirellula tenax]